MGCSQYDIAQHSATAIFPLRLSCYIPKLHPQKALPSTVSEKVRTEVRAEATAAPAGKASPDAAAAAAATVEAAVLAAARPATVALARQASTAAVKVTLAMAAAVSQSADSGSSVLGACVELKRF